MKYHALFVIFEKQLNFKLSSAANYRWRFMGYFFACWENFHDLQFSPDFFSSFSSEIPSECQTASLNPDQGQHFATSDLDPKCLKFDYQQMHIAGKVKET